MLRNFLNQHFKVHTLLPLGLTLLTALGALIVYQTSLRSSVDDQINRPIDFKLRSYLGYSPKVSSKLKILAFDDNAIAFFDKTDFTIMDWAKLYQMIDESEPKIMLTDKMFSVLYGKKRHPDFTKKMKTLNSPTAVASFTHGILIHGKPQVGDRNNLLFGEEVFEAPPDLKIEPQYLYGPQEIIRDSFSQIGHIDYLQSGIIQPYQISSTKKLVAHLGFAGAETMKPVDGGIEVNNTKITLDSRQGGLLVNFPQLKELRRRTTNLGWFVKNHLQNPQNKFIKKGDVVLVLPKMFTGNTDFASTPIGVIEGGYVLASLINSTLTGQWLQSFRWGPLSVFLAGLLAFGAYFLSHSLLFVLFYLLGCLAVTIVGTYSFVAWHTPIPWIMMLVSFTLSYTMIVFLKFRAVHGEKKRIRGALEGLISKEKIDSLAKSYTHIDFSPTNQEVTLMFIDMVGFSKLAEKFPPKQVFKNIKTTLNFISNTVYEMGGVVDKTLGDGILCYFGYDFGQDKETQFSTPHAERALMTAIKIQNFCLENILDEGIKYKPSPVRIGINTGTVYVGDIGGKDKVEITVIGHAVNYAQRLQAGCDQFKILMSEPTLLMIYPDRKYPAELTEKKIQIKHHEGDVRAFEYNPFLGEEKTVQQAIDYYDSEMQEVKIKKTAS